MNYDYNRSDSRLAADKPAFGQKEAKAYQKAAQKVRKQLSDALQSLKKVDAEARNINSYFGSGPWHEVTVDMSKNVREAEEAVKKAYQEMDAGIASAAKFL